MQQTLGPKTEAALRTKLMANPAYIEDRFAALDYSEPMLDFTLTDLYVQFYMAAHALQTNQTDIVQHILNNFNPERAPVCYELQNNADTYTEVYDCVSTQFAPIAHIHPAIIAATLVNNMEPEPEVLTLLTAAQERRFRDGKLTVHPKLETIYLNLRKQPITQLQGFMLPSDGKQHRKALREVHGETVHSLIWHHPLFRISPHWMQIYESLTLDI